jgi:hypothetical protein
VAFTVIFPTSGPVCSAPELVGWLTDRGEAFSEDGPTTVVLRALPIRFVVSPDQEALQAHLEVTSGVPLTRLVDVLFEVSMRAGSDVRLAGVGQVTRAALWMRLADEQDRLRIAEALQRAAEHGNADEVHKRLWAVLATLRSGHDDRWDTQQQRVVELVEVGEGISREQAAWHTTDPDTGDVIRVAVDGWLHCLVWRWLSEAYPGIAEAEHTLH